MKAGLVFLTFAIVGAIVGTHIGSLAGAEVGSAMIGAAALLGGIVNSIERK